MGVFEVISAIILLIVGVLLVMVIMLQKDRSEGLGAAYGDLGAFEGQRGRTLDMILRKWTRVLAIIFTVLIVATNIIVFVLK